jgi:molybdenum cofactor cytidylyltransferase
MAAEGEIAAIILAAGRSSRMGAHKLLLPLNGAPLLAWSLAAASASDARPVILALGRDAAMVADALPAGRYITLINPRYAEGMGVTLALAVGSLAPEVIGAVILLGDQPFMPTSTIQATLAAARAQPDRIIMGERDGRRGHPVYLPRRVFARVKALSGDEGARAIIAQEGDEITLVHIADARAQFDVDTLQDYRRAQEIAQLSGKSPA